MSIWSKQKYGGRAITLGDIILIRNDSPPTSDSHAIVAMVTSIHDDPKDNPGNTKPNATYHIMFRNMCDEDHVYRDMNAVAHCHDTVSPNTYRADVSSEEEFINLSPGHWCLSFRR